MIVMLWMIMTFIQMNYKVYSVDLSYHNKLAILLSWSDTLQSETAKSMADWDMSVPTLTD